jgi:5-methylcytosine-specific restriction endonuclease McrA
MELQTSTRQLHEKILILVARERTILAEILAHLQTVNDDKLFLHFGRESLLDYCVRDLGYSESAAMRRIKALRLTQKMPEVREAIERGQLNLTQAATMQSLFEQHSQEKRAPVTTEVRREVLALAQANSSREGEQRMREKLQLPARPRRVILDLDDSTFERWRQFRGTMVHKNWSLQATLNYLLDLAEQRLAEKFGAAVVAVKSANAAPAKRKSNRESKNQRYVSAVARREVWSRAKHCQYPGCASTYGLEIDHIRPIAVGGSSTATNLRLLCRHHNQARPRFSS